METSITNILAHICFVFHSNTSSSIVFLLLWAYGYLYGLQPPVVHMGNALIAEFQANGTNSTPQIPSLQANGNQKIQIFWLMYVLSF